MVKVRGLWLHQGIPDRGTNWDEVIENVREERIKSALKA